jgi:hypothetical protein
VASKDQSVKENIMKMSVCGGKMSNSAILILLNKSAVILSACFLKLKMRFGLIFEFFAVLR